MKISVHDVSRRFGNFTALSHVSLEIGSGELIALLGPSGSGKTTLLRVIAGLDWPDSGEVRFDDADALALTVGERNVGFVFQNYALFRHMTVFENIAFGLRAQKRGSRPAEAAIRERVRHLLDLVQLGTLGERYPNQLSGGQRQRIALARALARKPRVLLLDEPFGALDARVRKDLRRWLRRLHNEIHVTSVFVTHDQEEALEVADRVVVMDQGRIEQVGTPKEVYETPATPFVHDFIGESIVLPVVVSASDVQFHGEPLTLDPHGMRAGAALLFVRPSEMEIVPREQAAFRGTVARVLGLGSARRLEIELDAGKEQKLIEIVAPADEADVGQVVGLKPRSHRLYPNDQ